MVPSFKKVKNLNFKLKDQFYVITIMHLCIAGEESVPYRSKGYKIPYFLASIVSSVF